MCLLEIKKILNFRFSLVWLLSRKDQVTEQCREGYKPAKHFLWHAACGWQGFKCICFPFAFPFAKNSDSCCSALLHLPVISAACPGSDQLRLLPWAELEETHGWWQVPGQLLEPCCILARVLPLENWKLPTCSKSIWMVNIGVYFL